MTEPQARRVAWTWVNREYGARVFDNYTDPTTKACINKGFLEFTGELGKPAGGVPCKVYRASADGLRALGKFLSDATRMQQPTDAPRVSTNAADAPVAPQRGVNAGETD